MFPDDYYPYDAGTLLSSSVNEVVEHGRNLVNIPNGQVKENKKYKVDLQKGIPITFSSKMERSEGGACRVRIDYQIDEEWHYFYGNSLVSGISYATGTIPEEAYNICITFQFMMDTSGILTFEDVQVELGSKPTSYMPYKELHYQIQQSILDLPGYGWSAGDVCNEVDWENKKYVQRVEHKTIIPKSVATWGAYYMATIDIQFISYNGTASNYIVSQAVPRAENNIMLNKGYSQIILNNIDFQNIDDWYEYLIKNPIDLYYEITPIVTDISDLIPEGFLEAMEVEAGGSLTFANSNGDGYRIPVPNTVEYTVKLSEVASDD